VLINKAKLPNHYPQIKDYRADKSGQKRTKADINKNNCRKEDKRELGQKNLMGFEFLCGLIL
jgi:hypothetical protein